MRRRGFLKSLLVGGVSIGIYSFLEPHFKIDVTRVSLDLGAGKKVMFVSDTHFHGVDGREEQVIKMVSRYVDDVDMVIVAGDLYDEYTSSMHTLKRFLEVVGDKAYIVLGNHEHWASNKYPLDEALDILIGNGATILLNRSLWVDNLSIGGIDWYNDDPALGRKYLSSVGAVDILISHTPDIFSDAPGRYRLLLAGHTHGGQVFYGFGVVTPSRYGYISGLYESEGRRMYITRGLGEIIPVRVASSREITLIDI